MLNKIDINDYVDKNWIDNCLFKVQMPSDEELVKKWLDVLQCEWKEVQHTCFIDEHYAMIHAYMHKWMNEGPPVYVPPLDKEDYVEAAKILETIEHYMNFAGAENFKKVHFIQLARAKMNEQQIIKKAPELTYEI